MSLPDWNPKDYEVDFPDIITPPGTPIVNVHFIRKVGYIVDFLLGDILLKAKKAALNGYDLAGLLVALAAIDYLAGYFVGRETTRNDYIEFLRRYFPEKYHPYLDAIYKQIRCGLIHSLVPLNPWKGEKQIRFTIQGHSPLHLVELNGTTSFSIPVFIEDTIRAFIVYYHGLIMRPNENQELIINFEKRFKRLGGNASFMISLPD